MSVEAAAQDRVKYLLTIKRNERSPSSEIAAHHHRNAQAVSPSLTDARSSSSLERFPRSLIGAIEGSSCFRQSRHECGP
jgi:hypothetical protein